MLRNLKLLQHANNRSVFDVIFGKYYAKDISNNNPNHIFFRVCENTGFLWQPSYVGAIDLITEPNCTKIEFICTDKKASDYIENEEMFDSLIEYAIEKGKENKSSILKIDVHQNLRRYDKYIKKHGFELNGKKCDDNPYWVEAELKII